MSITVKKVTITTTETNYYICREKIMKRLAAYMATLPGCSISTPLVTDGHRFYVMVNVSSGNKDQIVFEAYGNDNSPTGAWGLCEDGFIPDLSSTSSSNRPMFYYNYVTMQNNVNDYHDYYFFISDGKLICFSDPMAGYMFFKHENSGLKTFCQRQTLVPNWNPTTSGTSGNTLMTKQTGGLDQDFSDIVVLHTNSGECKQSGGCRNTFLMSRGTYTIPSSKLLKYAKIELDNRFAVEKEVTEYPVSMTGDIIMTYTSFNYGDGIVGATYEKVLIGTQKYMHIGGSSWMPYDTITETTISAD